MWNRYPLMRRQFLDLMDKPDADSIEGLSPAAAIQQRGMPRTPRSTVGTITEVYDYLRLLFARIGTPHCPICSQPIVRQSVAQIVDRRTRTAPKDNAFRFSRPLIRNTQRHPPEYFQPVATGRLSSGCAPDGEILSLDSDINLDKNTAHNIEAVIRPPHCARKHGCAPRGLTRNSPRPCQWQQPHSTSLTMKSGHSPRAMLAPKATLKSKN